MMNKQEIEFPKTLQEAIIYFSNPDNALQFMVSLRWADGEAVCPICESKETSFLSTRRIWKCLSCKKQFSVKVGTLMEDSALGLDKWLCAIWMVANCKNGVSSYEIHRGLGITQKSAWFLLHRIRLAMQTGSFEKLSGTVESDETFIGGQARNMHKSKREKMLKGRRGAVGKAIVQGILERHGEVRAQVITDTKKETLQGNIRENVKAGSNVYTDSFPAYDGLDADFIHDFVNHAEQYVKGSVHTNGIENFWSLLKRGLKGTYVSVEPFHLFRYVDEQAFRFNNRKFKDFERFLMTCAALKGRRLTYQELTGKTTSREEEETMITYRDTLFPL